MLSDLLSRARIDQSVPWDWINDDTRPVLLHRSYIEPGTFWADQFQGFGRGYRRDLMQSQPNHVELVAEKNTVFSVIAPVAERYGIPLTITRGYCSLPPLRDIVKRFKDGGKQKLIVLAITDCDPDGEGIAESLAQSLVSDFHVDPMRFRYRKIALTSDQAIELGLPRAMEAKLSSSRHKAFIERHGNAAFELEAVTPDVLQRLVAEAVEAVIDMQAFKAEEAAELADATANSGFRKKALDVLKALAAQVDGQA